MIAVGGMEIATSAPPPGLGLVTLKDETGDRALPIFMLTSQVEAIQEANLETSIPRTHDLLRTVIEGLGASLISVAITAVREGTFYAELELRQGDTAFRIPARPSDAIALAVRVPKTPIFIDEAVFDAMGQQPNTIRISCPDCDGGATFTLIRDDDGAKVRQYGTQAEFSLPGVVEWVCFGCGHEHRSRLEPPPTTLE
jgi:uncharacterized protein